MSKPDKVIKEKVIGFQIEKQTHFLDVKKALLYNVSLGYSNEPMNKEDLEFTYELAENFRINPSQVTTQVDINVLFGALQECPGLPEFNPMMLLHGEQKIVQHLPLQVDQKYYIVLKIVDCQDKKKGAVIVFQQQVFQDEKMTELQSESCNSIFIRGIGGFDTSEDKQKVWINIPQPPKKQPIIQLEQKTDPNQAILYRINADLNPLHIDPDMASLGGFDKPILHGLCTYGISGKLLLQKLAGNDTKKFVQQTGRFTSHVFPGETLVVNVWQLNETQFVYATTTKERGKVVLVGLYEIQQGMNVKL